MQVIARVARGHRSPCYRTTLRGDSKVESRDYFRRQVFITYIIACASMFCVSLIIHYYGKVPMTFELLQLQMLCVLVVANALYIFYILYRFNEDAGVYFIVIFPLGNFLARLVYTRFFPDLDARTQALQVLGVLIATTLVVHFVRRRAASHRSN